MYRRQQLPHYRLLFLLLTWSLPGEMHLFGVTTLTLCLLSIYLPYQVCATNKWNVLWVLLCFYCSVPILIPILLPALLPKQASNLLPARTPRPCPQLLVLFLWAESFPVAQSASTRYIRQCCVLTARSSQSVSSTTRTIITFSTTLPNGCSAVGFRVHWALWGTDGGAAGGNKYTWRWERILGGLIRGQVGFWLRVIPGTETSYTGGGCWREQRQMLGWLRMLSRLRKGFRLGLFQRKVATLHSYFTSSENGTAIWKKEW